MAGYEDLREYIKTKLLPIPGIGKIQDYYRYLKGNKTIKAELYVDGVLNVWFILPGPIKESWEGPGSLLKAHSIQLIGAHGIVDADATGKSFLTMAQTVLAAFQADYTWGGLCFQTTPPALTKFTSQSTFSNMYCHQAIIQLNPMQRETI